MRKTSRAFFIKAYYLFKRMWQLGSVLQKNFLSSHGLNSTEQKTDSCCFQSRLAKKSRRRTHGRTQFFFTDSAKRQKIILSDTSISISELTSTESSIQAHIVGGITSA